MEFKGTPGEWRINSGSEKFIDATQPDGMIQEVAWCGDVAYGDRMANAQLISAAPEMLEVLQLIVDAQLLPVYHQSLVRAAINKALGEE